MDLQKKQNMEKKDFREFEVLRVGNYVRYENGFWKVTKINKPNSPKDGITVNLKGLHNDIPLSKIHYIELTEKLLLSEEFGFERIEQDDEFQLNFVFMSNVRTTFKKKNGSLTLVDYTSNEGTGKYCIYERSLKRIIYEASQSNEFKDAYSIVKENTQLIYHIHALQNYFDKYPDDPKIDFDAIITHLKKS